MALESVPTAISLSEIPQVYNVGQQADYGQWDNNKIAFISNTAGF